MATLARLSRIAINRILLATDFSAESENALQCSIALTRRYESTLILTHIVSPKKTTIVGEGWSALVEAVRENAQESVRELEEAHDLSRVPHEVIIRAGDAGDAIAHEAPEQNVDLVVMGTHGYGGFKKLFLGSTAETVIRHSACPVLTVGPHFRLKSMRRFSEIIFATDFSPGSKRGLTYALSLAEQDRAELTMLHVIQSMPVSNSEVLEWKRDDREKLNQLLPPDIDLPTRPEIEVEVGIPEEEIVRLADTRQADLIVMGSHTGGAFSAHVPWTTLHHVLQHAHCPVLTVRS